MVPCLVTEHVAVYDDFLSVSDQLEIRRYLDSARFRRILPDAWGKAYRMANGDPLVGIEVLSASRERDANQHVYPTETALDLVIEGLLRANLQISELLGEQGKAWDYFTVCPYVYPAFSGLGWHSDPHSAGAFVYYVHETWGIHWGGELLVDDSGFPCPPAPVSSRGILRNEAMQTALRSGVGRYITPAPNRLVLLRGKTAHMIKNVEQAAGDHVRLSISGFFSSYADASPPRKAHPVAVPAP